MANADLAGNILLNAFGLLLVLHILIMVEVSTSEYRLGGQIKADQSNLIQMKICSHHTSCVFCWHRCCKNQITSSQQTHHDWHGEIK